MSLHDYLLFALELDAYLDDQAIPQPDWVDVDAILDALGPEVDDTDDSPWGSANLEPCTGCRPDGTCPNGG